MEKTEEATQVNKLVTQFQAASKLYFEGRNTFNTRKQSRALKKILSSLRELDAAGSGQRPALLPLLDSDDVEVAVMAASYLVKLAPEHSRTLLRWVDKHGDAMTSMWAMTALDILNSGHYLG
jgi:hypothetical protein